MPPHITLTRQAPCTSSSWPVNILYWILITLLYIGPSDLCSTPFKPPTRIHVPCRGGHPWADHGYTELHDCEGAVPAPALGYRVSGNNYFVDSYISNIRNQLASPRSAIIPPRLNMFFDCVLLEPSRRTPNVISEIQAL